MIKNIENKVEEIIINNLESFNEKKLTDDKDLIVDLGMESLEIMGVIMELEEQFKVEIDIDLLEDIQNVGKMKKYIKKLIEENNNC